MSERLRRHVAADQARAKPAGRTPDAGAEHPLLALQRLAGNAAVAGLVDQLSVQRFWPFDDEEEEAEPADESEYEEDEEEIPEDEEEYEDEEESPDGGDVDISEESIYWPAGRAKFTGLVARGSIMVSGFAQSAGTPWDRKAADEAWPIAMDQAGMMPYEAIPRGITAGGGGYIEYVRPPFTTPFELQDTRDLVGRQAMRHLGGSPSPDIERIYDGTNTPDGAPGSGGGEGPQPGGGGTGPAPGAGGGTSPGSGTPGGGIPGLQPIPGGYAAGWPAAPGPGEAPSIPGLEPVPAGGAGSGGTGAGAGGPATTRPMLRRGSTGNDVVDLQGLLVRRGATLNADGIFGGLTREAVVDFQQRSGLGADGIVGPLTWQALEQG
jgi:hypothetical protein